MTVYLFDTNILLWWADGSPRLPTRARQLIKGGDGARLFSALCIAEVAIKTARGSPGFDVDAGDLRSGLLSAGLAELPLSGLHAVRLGDLALLHKDPFDRLLVAQAIVEGLTLVTSDALLARYSRRVMVV